MTAPAIEVVTVYTAMASVMRDIGAVGKSDYNDHQKFNFRGIDSITNAVYGPMCTHGVVVVPEVIDSHYEEVTTSGGKPSRQATLTVRYRFYGPQGDYVDAVTIGEAMDSADKATSKALAAAFKYALLQTFAIPTAGQEDADSSSPQRDAPPEMISPEEVALLIERLDNLGHYPDAWRAEHLPSKKNMAYMTAADFAVADSILSAAEFVGVGAATTSEASPPAEDTAAPTPTSDEIGELLAFSDEPFDPATGS